MVKAKGKKNGRTILVECSFGKEQTFLFNGKAKPSLEAEILFEMKQHHPIGGTYFPKTEKLNAVAVLEGYFFDLHPESIKIYGEIEEIPCEKGMIY